MENNLTNPNLPPLQENEFCHLERVFRENGYLSFTGKEKIQHIDDVAYLFRSLSDYSIENIFFVLVKDEKPVILHAGMGSFSQTAVCTPALIAAIDRINPDQVYTVHNHPGGNLTPSYPDQKLHENLRLMVGERLCESIIINLKSGSYGVYTDSGHYSIDMPRQKEENPVKTYCFDKYVFHSDYIPPDKLLDSEKVAAFLSSHKLGDRQKLSFLCINNKAEVVANIFTPYANINPGNTKEIAAYLVNRAVHTGGRGIIAYGNMGTENDMIERLEREITKASVQEIQMTDFIQVTPSKALSWRNEDTLLSVAEIKEAYKHYQPNTNNMEQKKYQIDEARINWPEMKDKYSITREMLEQENVLNELLNRKISSKLITVTYNSRDGVKEYPSRIEFLPKGEEVAFRFHPKLEHLDLTAPYQNHSFNEQEQFRLLNQDNVVIEVEDYRNGGQKKVLVTYDELTNRLFQIDVNRIRLPKEFFSVPITNEIATQILQGGRAKAKNIQMNGKTFSSDIRLNACTRMIEIIFPQKKIIENLNDLTHINSVPVTDEIRKKLNDGKKFKLSGQIGKDGKPFTSSIWFDKESKTIKHEFPKQKKGQSPKVS